MDRRPIGVMDSGLGGLSVLRVLRDQLPDESLTFVGDQGHFPYGTKSQEEICRLSLSIGHFLVEQGAKMMVIACNTATGAALPTLQRELPIPVVGVIEPGAKAALATGAKTVGVIGTESTIKNGAYAATINRLAPDVKVISHPAQPLVSIVEHGKTGTSESQAAVDDILSVFDQEPVDSLVLGCTHFPFLTNEIQRKMGDSVHLVDPAIETVQEVKRILTEGDLLAPAGNGDQAVHLYSTGDKLDLQAGANQWLNGMYETCNHLDL
ncbi:MAG: glutamate racemase [Limosilactobacillus sp.]|uniref:glutamate racemase n=1 Tax=Limosilactobacillus sp. TaxID=2773925 RepID=UPI0026F9EF63|nr:glutamate racemase [Limosilactobacillus sp.]